MLVLAAGTASATPAPDAVEYLYAEANEGGSSGGHVGLRIGVDVYHFQQHEGWLRLLRQDATEFVAEYALAGNRPLHALRLDVAPEAARALRERFEQRRRAGESQRERLRLLRDDRALLETRRLAVPGAGFFYAEAPAPPPERAEPVLEALRARIAARYGADFLAAREAALRAEREQLAPSALPPLPALTPELELPFADAWSARQADLAAALTALELLRDAPSLRAGSTLAQDGAPLDAAERAALCGVRAPLADELVALVASPRGDWGRGFLLGAARLLALEQSCARAEWVVLDASAGAALSLVPAPRAEALMQLTRDAQAAQRDVRARFVRGGWSGRRLAAVEEVGALERALRDAARTGRLALWDVAAPQRPAPRVDLPSPPGAPASLAAVLVQMLARERAAERAFTALHGYHLTRHNCVSELLATLEAVPAIAPPGGAVPPGPARGVPFLSAAAVRQRYRVAEARVLPSLRELRRAQLVAGAGALARLRELSPVTAQSFAPAAVDSRFLVFADTPWLRPLAGAANLAAGLGAAALGIARAPWDGGAQLSAGLRGAFWSLPELAFVNVRKGTNEYVAPEWLAWAAEQVE